jgi:hypothetical protein
MILDEEVRDVFELIVTNLDYVSFGNLRLTCREIKGRIDSVLYHFFEPHPENIARWVSFNKIHGKIQGRYKGGYVKVVNDVTLFDDTVGSIVLHFNKGVREGPYIEYIDGKSLSNISHYRNDKLHGNEIWISYVLGNDTYDISTTLYINGIKRLNGYNWSVPHPLPFKCKDENHTDCEFLEIE